MVLVAYVFMVLTRIYQSLYQDYCIIYGSVTLWFLIPKLLFLFQLMYTNVSIQVLI